MQIQQVKIIDEKTLEEQIINVPCENGERIISNSPYVLEYVNKYRSSWGSGDLEAITEFETLRDEELINDVTIERNDDKFVIDINKKYDYTMPIANEPEEVVSSFDSGVKYKIPVSASTKNGLNISIKDSIKIAVKQELRQAAVSKDKSNAYSAHIDECINGGYYVTIQGVKCFMPGSTASLYKLKNFESIVGKDIMVIPTMYNMQRDMVVVSHVAFLEAIKPSVLQSVMKDDKDKKFTGIVTLKKYDYVLVTFNECLAGKLCYSDMDETTKEMFKNNQLELEKTELEFNIDYEQNGQLLLTQTYYTRSLWKEKIVNEIKPKTTMDGVIVGSTKNFILVQLKYNVIGTLPFNNNTKFSNGDHINVKVVAVDSETRKIKLSL